MNTPALQPDDALRRLLLAASVGPRQILNAPEACAWLGVYRPSVKHAKRYLVALRSKGLRSVRVGKFSRWRVSDLSTFVEGLGAAEQRATQRKPRIAS